VQHIVIGIFDMQL